MSQAESQATTGRDLALFFFGRECGSGVRWVPGTWHQRSCSAHSSTRRKRIGRCFLCRAWASWCCSLWTLLEKIAPHPCSQSQHERYSETCLSWQLFNNMTPARQQQPGIWERCKRAAKALKRDNIREDNPYLAGGGGRGKRRDRTPVRRISSPAPRPAKTSARLLEGLLHSGGEVAERRQSWATNFCQREAHVLLGVRFGGGGWCFGGLLTGGRLGKSKRAATSGSLRQRLCIKIILLVVLTRLWLFCKDMVRDSPLGIQPYQH